MPVTHNLNLATSDRLDKCWKKSSSSHAAIMAKYRNILSQSGTPTTTNGSDTAIFASAAASPNQSETRPVGRPARTPVRQSLQQSEEDQQQHQNVNVETPGRHSSNATYLLPPVLTRITSIKEDYLSDTFIEDERNGVLCRTLENWHVKIGRNKSVVVVGKYNYMKPGDSFLWTTSPIVQRVRSRILSTSSASIYYIIGPYCPSQEHDDIPEDIAAQFTDGFPGNWKELLSKVDVPPSSSSQILQYERKSQRTFSRNQSLMLNSFETPPSRHAVTRRRAQIETSDSIVTLNPPKTPVPPFNPAKARRANLSTSTATSLGYLGRPNRRDPRDLVTNFNPPRALSVNSNLAPAAEKKGRGRPAVASSAIASLIAKPPPSSSSRSYQRVVAVDGVDKLGQSTVKQTRSPSVGRKTRSQSVDRKTSSQSVDRKTRSQSVNRLSRSQSDTDLVGQRLTPVTKDSETVDSSSTNDTRRTKVGSKFGSSETRNSGLKTTTDPRRSTRQTKKVDYFVLNGSPPKLRVPSVKTKSKAAQDVVLRPRSNSPTNKNVPSAKKKPVKKFNKNIVHKIFKPLTPSPKPGSRLTQKLIHNSKIVMRKRDSPRLNLIPEVVSRNSSSTKMPRANRTSPKIQLSKVVAAKVKSPKNVAVKVPGSKIVVGSVQRSRETCTRVQQRNNAAVTPKASARNSSRTDNCSRSPGRPKIVSPPISDDDDEENDASAGRLGSNNSRIDTKRRRLSSDGGYVNIVAKRARPGRSQDAENKDVAVDKVKSKKIVSPNEGKKINDVSITAKRGTMAFSRQKRAYLESKAVAENDDEADFLSQGAFQAKNYCKGLSKHLRKGLVELMTDDEDGVRTPKSCVPVPSPVSDRKTPNMSPASSLAFMNPTNRDDVDRLIINRGKIPKRLKYGAPSKSQPLPHASAFTPLHSKVATKRWVNQIQNLTADISTLQREDVDDDESKDSYFGSNDGDSE